MAKLNRYGMVGGGLDYSVICQFCVFPGADTA